MTNLTPIFEVVIMLIVALISTFLIPYIKSKTNTNKLNDMVFWLETAVMAYEEAGRKGIIDKNQKYDMVVEFMESKGYTFNIDEIQTLIDRTVYELINQFKEEKGV